MTKAQPFSQKFEAKERKMRPQTTHTDNGNDYKSFLAQTNAALREQKQLPDKMQHAAKFLNQRR
eukprot:CAMPEP_0167740698 /NCGR_PEP_ID=MMETSP0110_2-20121227/430_1 /TAXON_ID=629695 /ORGANISM="Gymnochlora sp., Strain CCMP2014" /LENGTH=63 /DNA_ID=CAMNT_0007624637 /DNA_START=129 /DNA_END=320 /DNA_ORIENTATION=-